MKKSILMILAAFSVSITVAQNNPPATNPARGTNNPDQRTQTQSGTTPQSSDVPGTISKRFSTDYPNTQSNWSQVGTNYRAEYADTASRLTRAIIYDVNGNPVGSESQLGNNEYPRTIGDYYSKSYPNEKYNVWSSQDNTGKRSYYITRESDVIWFDDKGNYQNKTPRTINRTDTGNFNR